MPNDALQEADARTITGDENLLVLVPHPGDETRFCGGLIAACCRIGRPPFVMVLDDGSATDPLVPPAELANRLERATRAAVRCLGLPDGRLLMAGVYQGTLPDEGVGFDAVVRAVTLVTWARDCNVICAPWPAGSDPADTIAHRVAATVAVATGIAHISTVGRAVPSGAPGWRLADTVVCAVKVAALAEAGLPDAAALQPEIFLRQPG